MARRRSRKRKKTLTGRVALALAVLVFGLCSLLTAGEHYGWQLPGWGELERWLGVSEAPPETSLSQPADGQGETGSQPAQTAGQTDTEIHFIDAGQADATLIRQGDAFLLIDAGDLGDGDQLVSYLKNAGVTRLDCVVMTHPHADHIGGMPQVLEAFPVDRFLLPDFALLDELPTSAIFQRTLEALAAQKENGCEVLTAARGQEIQIGEGTLRVLLAGVETDNTNDLSICAKFVCGGFSCLFTGDGESAVEKELLAIEPNLRADIFQAGHHGSSTSNSAKLLAAVRPDCVVISCGLDNSYGHPHEEALERFDAVGAEVCRTDLQGSIVIRPAEDGGLLITAERDTEV